MRPEPRGAAPRPDTSKAGAHRGRPGVARRPRILPSWRPLEEALRKLRWRPRSSRSPAHHELVRFDDQQLHDLPQSVLPSPELVLRLYLVLRLIQIPQYHILLADPPLLADVLQNVEANRLSIMLHNALRIRSVLNKLLKDIRRHLAPTA